MQNLGVGGFLSVTLSAVTLCAGHLQVGQELWISLALSLVETGCFYRSVVC